MTTEYRRTSKVSNPDAPPDRTPLFSSNSDLSKTILSWS